MTSVIQKGFPNAGIGANFAPTVYKIDPRDKQQYCLNYLGETFQVQTATALLYITHVNVDS